MRSLARLPASPQRGWMRVFKSAWIYASPKFSWTSILLFWGLDAHKGVSNLWNTNLSLFSPFFFPPRSNLCFWMKVCCRVTRGSRCFGPCVDVISAQEDEMLMNLGPKSYFQTFSCVLFLRNTTLCIQMNSPPTLSPCFWNWLNNSYF